MATDEAIRKAAGRKVYRYSLDDGNGTQPLLFKVENHVTSEGNTGAECRDEKGASP